MAGTTALTAAVPISWPNSRRVKSVFMAVAIIDARTRLDETCLGREEDVPVGDLPGNPGFELLFAFEPASGQFCLAPVVELANAHAEVGAGGGDEGRVALAGEAARDRVG